MYRFFNVKRIFKILALKKVLLNMFMTRVNSKLIPVCTPCCCLQQASTHFLHYWVGLDVAANFYHGNLKKPWSAHLWSFLTPFLRRCYSGKLNMGGRDVGRKWLRPKLMFYFWSTTEDFKLTLADFLVRHVVSSREAIFSHSHVSVESQWEDPSGWLDFRRYFGPTVSANQRAHC